MVGLSLAYVSILEGDLDQSAAFMTESSAIRWEIQDRRSLADSVEGLAWIASARSDATSAARLFGLAERQREANGTIVQPWLEKAHVQGMNVVHARLGEQVFQTLWSAALTEPLEQAVPETITRTLESTATKHNDASHVTSDSLTRREREVAALIASGMTDRQIAHKLVISEGTVGLHVVHILRKLGVRSRAQGAVWAAKHGLRSKSMHSS
jgi:DNA-binding CsgD family transcriptional regulator